MSDKNKQTTFNHKWVDEEGIERTGIFTAKRISVMDRTRMNTRRSQLSGGMYCVRDENGNPTGQGIDPDTDYINAMIAHLEVALIQSPIWFKLEEISDMGLVTDVYEKVMQFEMNFFRRRDGSAADQSQRGASGEAHSSQESSVEGHTQAPAEVVGQEVQAALDA